MVLSLVVGVPVCPSTMLSSLNNCSNCRTLSMVLGSRSIRIHARVATRCLVAVHVDAFQLEDEARTLSMDCK